MRELIDNILADESIDNDTKLKMLKQYKVRWFNEMVSTTQSNEQLTKNLESLNIIHEAIGKLS